MPEWYGMIQCPTCGEVYNPYETRGECPQCDFREETAQQMSDEYEDEESDLAQIDCRYDSMDYVASTKE